MRGLRKIGRVLNSPLGLLAVVLAGLAAIPVWDALARKITASEMTAQVVSTTDGFVHNPLVILAFMFLALLTLKTAGKKVAKAEAARVSAESKRAEALASARDEAFADIKRMLLDNAEQTKARLEVIFEEALVVPRLLAQRKRIREHVEQVNALLTSAGNTLNAYRGAMNQVRGGLRTGAAHLSGIVRDQLRNTIQVVNQAGSALGEPTQLSEIDDAAATIENRADWDGLRFDPAQNEYFIRAHDRNADLLQSEIQRLQSVTAKRNNDSLVLDRQIEASLAKYGA